MKKFIFIIALPIISFSFTNSVFTMEIPSSDPNIEISHEKLRISIFMDEAVEFKKLGEKFEKENNFKEAYLSYKSTLKQILDLLKTLNLSENEILEDFITKAKNKIKEAKTNKTINIKEKCQLIKESINLYFAALKIVEPAAQRYSKSILNIDELIQDKPEQIEQDIDYQIDQTEPLLKVLQVLQEEKRPFSIENFETNNQDLLNDPDFNEYLLEFNLGFYLRLLSVLDLNQNATLEDIETQYKKLSKRVHPDKNPGKDTTNLFKLLGQTKDYLEKFYAEFNTR